MTAKKREEYKLSLTNDKEILSLKYDDEETNPPLELKNRQQKKKHWKVYILNISKLCPLLLFQRKQTTNKSLHEVLMRYIYSISFP